MNFMLISKGILQRDLCGIPYFVDDSADANSKRFLFNEDPIIGYKTGEYTPQIVEIGAEKTTFSRGAPPLDPRDIATSGWGQAPSHALLTPPCPKHCSERIYGNQNRTVAIWSKIIYLMRLLHTECVSEEISLIFVSGKRFSRGHGLCM